VHDEEEEVLHEELVLTAMRWAALYSSLKIENRKSKLCESWDKNRRQQQERAEHPESSKLLGGQTATKQKNILQR